MALLVDNILDALEQFGVAMGTNLGRTKLTRMASLYLATKLLRHRLHAVADTQHRDTQFKHRLGRLVRRLFVDAGMAARQNHPFELAVCSVSTNPFIADIAGMYFAKHMRWKSTRLNSSHSQIS